VARKPGSFFAFSSLPASQPYSFQADSPFKTLTPDPPSAENLKPKIKPRFYKLLARRNSNIAKLL
jgi:hypothetical protein